MRLLVVGAGATGGYFGGRLAAVGRDVTFLVRPARAEHLKTKGLQIVSGDGEVSLTPKIATADTLAESYDAILVTVKAYSLEPALRDVAAAVGPDTMILPTLNGMRHVDVLTERFGERLVGCVCKVAATVDDAGRIVQLTAGFHELAYGEMSGAPSTRTEQLHGFMQGAGFNARLTPTIAREMWEKWTMLASLGGACCLLRGTVGEIASAPGGEAFMHSLLDEVVAAVTAVGLAPSEAHVAGVRRMLTDKSSTHASSMYRDLLKGGPVEADQIVGDLLGRAQRAGIATPLLAAAYANLSIYQSRLAK
jgi:2-dehydropantoate 2-reductase